jgi:hypothetical protein
MQRDYRACFMPRRGRLIAMSTNASSLSEPAFDRYDPLGLDGSLSSDEIAVRDTVRKFCAEHVTPHIA